ncbi:hypothetical protein BJ878DRAFT_520099 [Calycina marina]|uniref:DUF7918 domain-containing protein n=1 Tax=Calycina marina TaxID=1763456 RepID=A0A9P7YXN9_9HELO|nr:hypothetical protein BJ878DRAFT_520099 [Calycina marina]
MAVLDNLPGIRVSLQSDGFRQTEYQDTDEPLKLEPAYTLPPPGRVALKYVEVVAEADFLIKCEVLAPHIAMEDISFTAEVDGIRIATNVAEHLRLTVGYWYGHIDGYYKRIDAERVSCRPLRFCGLTKVDTDDSETISRDAKMMKGVGEIIVYVHRTRREGREQAMIRTEPKAVKEVSEKALKGQAISHSAGYGAEKYFSKPQNQGTLWMDPYYKPLAVFRFKYRSKEALQAMMVIPRSASPERFYLAPIHSPDRNWGVVSRQERVANLKMELAKIKAEDDGEEENPVRSRKREASDSISSGRAYKTSQRRDGKVVVDLTDG